VHSKGNEEYENLAYISQVLPILESGAAFWDLYGEGQVIA